MPLANAITAAQQAGNTTAQDIQNYLLQATEDKTDSGARLTASDVVEVLGLTDASALLVDLQALAITDGMAHTIVTLLTTGGHLRTGSSTVQSVISSLVADEVLTQSQADALIAYGQRPIYRYDTFGLDNLPTVKQILSSM